ncbi:hypothetical protein Pan161_56680 [Gimesia algae]|uniref:Lipoprotein n=2 Tax=Gimesia algae TaxID=2527971 RepID=A0A517VLS4_9PLAN|nr:hypothetical protein Pan161_56680 [Gimesia algae]
MFKIGKQFSRALLLGCACLLTLNTSGCTLVKGFIEVTYAGSVFWRTTPLIPVTAYWSQLIEDTYWEEERYNKAMILDPVEGEHAPLFCLDPPSPDEVIRALPDKTGGGVWFLAETTRNNVRMVVEPIVDRIGECRFYPMVGPARQHHCHYKCTVYYDKTIRSDWPVPFSHNDQTKEVVYIDHDHLIRCAGPQSE